jgi:hypothetical protein
MNIRCEEFFALCSVLSGYFNQDYDGLYGDYEGALQTARLECGATFRRSVVEDIDRLLSLKLEGAGIEAAIEALGCALYLPAFGKTPESFLGDVREAMVAETPGVPKPA